MLPTVQPDAPLHSTTPKDKTLPTVRFTQIPASASWRKWNWLFRALGVGVALTGGIVAASLAPARNGLALAAALLGSWWAALIVPVFVNAGITAFMERPVLNVGSLLKVILPAAIGAVIGPVVGGWIERRLHR